MSFRIQSSQPATVRTARERAKWLFLLPFTDSSTFSASERASGILQPRRFYFFVCGWWWCFGASPFYLSIPIRYDFDIPELFFWFFLRAGSYELVVAVVFICDRKRNYLGVGAVVVVLHAECISE